MTDEKAGIFGIDLGTTYSVVAYIDDTGRPAVTRNNYRRGYDALGRLLRRRIEHSSGTSC